MDKSWIIKPRNSIEYDEGDTHFGSIMESQRSGQVVMFFGGYMSHGVRDHNVDVDPMFNMINDAFGINRKCDNEAQFRLEENIAQDEEQIVLQMKKLMQIKNFMN
ncbi:hypothetical protein K1719_047368 [Acacia pycnantha]|nr:hypothetical protein K1719_047368 [Acacia pycnantha]